MDLMAKAAPSDVVCFEHVDKAFADVVVFRDLSLAVREGEILTVMGGSGCGKSVLLKMILGLTPWQAGRVVIDGEDITGKDEQQMLEVRRKVGMLFQGGALFDSLDVRENIAYPLRERGVSDERAIGQRVQEVLEMVGLPGVEAKVPDQLSGGMRKRVALARAIAPEPKVILYDEPTTGLDPINVRRISELILSLRDRLGVTTIVVTHDLASAFMVSDRLAMIADRHVVAVAPAAELQRSHDPRVREFLDAMASEPARVA
jgi:phospholipid/cholesterol/gamma-HCH transport system ATP-binding protein